MLKWAITLLIVFEAGYMLVDGIHGLSRGDYIGPKDKSGQTILGPWSKVVPKIGVNPSSKLMKSIFVAYGVLWLVLLIAFWLDASWSKTALIAMAAGSLWYLPIGTLDSLIQILLLTRIK